jgi:hypothetical protein
MAMDKKYINLRSVRNCIAVTGLILVCATLTFAQGRARARKPVKTARTAATVTTVNANSASHVSAEVSKGKLSTTGSNPGDAVVVKLKEDVRSNGEIVVKKGTSITGIVRNVKRAEANGPMTSIMEIVWLAPEPQGKVPHNVSFALQSVNQANAANSANSIDPREEASGEDFEFVNAGPAALARPLRGSNATLVRGTLAIVDTGTASSVSGLHHASGASNPALMSMPSVVAADHDTSSAIESSLGGQASGQLFKVGHGLLASGAGSQQSVDIFSHLNNDTVITSPSEDFEIGGGAQMLFLVGVNRK